MVRPTRRAHEPRSGGDPTEPNITDPAVDFEPVFVGNKVGLGSSVLDLGSAVVGTPGAIGGILELLGVDTGSLGSSGSGDGRATSSGSGEGSSGS